MNELSRHAEIPVSIISGTVNISARTDEGINIGLLVRRDLAAAEARRVDRLIMAGSRLRPRKEQAVGDYRFVLEGIGSHGCNRMGDSGSVVARCGNGFCVDCRIADFVRSFQAVPGMGLKTAVLEHWPVPGAAGTTRTDNPGPIDDLVTGTRLGSFVTQPYISPSPAAVPGASPTPPAGKTIDQSGDVGARKWPDDVSA